MANPPPAPELDPMLAELAELGMGAVRDIARLIAIERQAAEIVATWLPDKATTAASMADAVAAGHAIDSAAAALAGAVSRVAALTRAKDRLSRSVRLTIALRRRLQTGWTGASASDTRAAMQRRQVKRGVGERIRNEAPKRASGERETEDLFAELDEELNDPGLDDEIAATSVEQVVQRICREIGLAAAAIRSMAPKSRDQTRGSDPAHASPAHPPDNS